MLAPASAPLGKLTRVPQVSVGPLIPYIVVPELPLLGRHTIHVLGQTVDLGPWTIKPFGTLVALGVYLGILLVMRYARERGIHRDVMSRFVLWVLVCAFVAGHMLDTLFYHPGHVLRDPWSLLRIWDGLSSFGGFAGAMIGVFAFKYHFKIKRIMPLTDTMAAAFPVGWVFGRMGCSVVHDHLGMRSQLWFALQRVNRFDLGLLEMIFAAIIALTAIALARKPRPPGFFLGLTMLAYAPTRFALDFLRAQPGDLHDADPRYLVLTPAQWASVALALGGFYLLAIACNSRTVGNEPYRDLMNEIDVSVFARPKPGSTEPPR